MRKLLRKFGLNKNGMAAVEFAFIAPVMLTLFFGTVELCNALICQQKVTSVASTAADLVAQDSAISDTQLDDVFAALDSIIYPYSTTGATIIITSIVLDSNGNPVVAWSKAQNGTAYSAGTAMPVPSGLITPGGSVIYAEIRYTYDSPLSHFITNPIVMTDSFYSRPRKSLEVAKI